MFKESFGSSAWHVARITRDTCKPLLGDITRPNSRRRATTAPFSFNGRGVQVQTSTSTSILVHEISQVTTSLLGTAISNDSPLMSAGLDSIGATELARKLGDRLRVVLPSTLLFDHPSV